MHLFMADVGIRTRTDAATSPSIAMYGVSTDCAKKGSSNSTDKEFGHHSTLRIGSVCCVNYFYFEKVIKRLYMYTRLAYPGCVLF